MPTLTKSFIVEHLIEKNGYDRTQATDTINEILEIIKEKLSAGEDVMISGFGKFSVKDKSERIGRNPTTNKPMTLPERRVVTFKSAGKLREKLNQL